MLSNHCNGGITDLRRQLNSSLVVKHRSIFSFVFWGRSPASIFLRNRIFLKKTSQSGRGLLAFGSYCPAWRTTSRGQKLLILSFFIFKKILFLHKLDGFIMHVKVPYRGPCRFLTSLGLLALGISNQKGPLYGNFSYTESTF